MPIPFVIDNQDHRLANVLNDLLAQTCGKAFDPATAYFAVSGFRIANGPCPQSTRIERFKTAASALGRPVSAGQTPREGVAP